MTPRCIRTTSQNNSSTIQKYLFRLGYTWNGIARIMHTNKPLLYVNPGAKNLTWGSFPSGNHSPNRLSWESMTDEDAIAYLKNKAAAEETNLDDSKKHWEFKTTHPNDIVWASILESLTPANPLGLVDTPAGRAIAIHYSLVAKTNTLVPRLDLGGPILLASTAGVVFQTALHFSVWVAWAKAVKNAPWPTTGRAPGKVVVNLPTI